MLHELKDLMLKLPEMLRNPAAWDSLIINRRKPATYRVFRHNPNNPKQRVCLHRFDPCVLHEAFSHPHPWPAAFLLLSGCYQMEIGYSLDRYSQPTKVCSTELHTGSAYEIINPLTWHAVIPKRDDLYNNVKLHTQRFGRQKGKTLTRCRLMS